MHDEWLCAETRSSDGEGELRGEVSPLNEYVGGGATSLLDMEEKTQGRLTEPGGGRKEAAVFQPKMREADREGQLRSEFAVWYRTRDL
jgi:hypothetical protein